MTLRACSHLVIATADVPRITDFFGRVFGVLPHFANDMFSEFVLPSAFRVAFFTPVGPTATTFDDAAPRTSIAIGVTVDDVDAVHATASTMATGACTVSGPPKDHPWGERSFLLTDPDGNRWEVTASPTDTGMLRNRSGDSAGPTSARES
jgi:catechol 2,3-dioxygenase-like lactoylglutathione lyase family enzyme